MAMNAILCFLNLGTGEIILIVAVILLLFGGKKIPELMRGLGKGVKSFKQGMNEVEDELKKPLEDLEKKDAPKEWHARFILWDLRFFETQDFASLQGLHKCIL